MNKNLTTSKLHRKNILNNNYALEIIYNEISFYGVMFESKYRFTKKQIVEFYEIDQRTIDRYIQKNKTEFEESGYEVLTGKRLKDFKLVYGNDINVVTIDESIQKTSILGVFTFRAFLNIGMLLTESEKAKKLRTLILDLVIDSINKKLGGNTKYINQREEEFLPSALREHDYRQEFTNTLDNYVEPSKFKYGQLTNKVYKSIFKEDAQEYRQILNLKKKDTIRSTMYSEVLDLISSYENGFADFLKNHSEKQHRKLSLPETNTLFDQFEILTNAIYQPLREKSRGLMASRDMAFREALHEKLKNYITPLSSEEFDKFLGKKSLDLEQRILNNIDVFKRLKNK
ncbi:DNA-binding protein [Tenacibaculum piscium]|uniref:DNA-binding protein n=1 Tax=Tenacibaculum piscium TaxID=1458515 RepID=UPI001EFBB494|nr:DNA-binding protein [Tenacibaculum piscium]MCG8183686.1 DNA-binding protein [Tenacibaculum piscium]MCG8204827.1 DNA-binding protein [Tenacibaculum piscium]